VEDLRVTSVKIVEEKISVKCLRILYFTSANG
jgi:hypothetical protein